jgi:hypothetical protein
MRNLDLCKPYLQKILDHFYMTIHILADDAGFLEISCILYGFLPILQVSNE